MNRASELLSESRYYLEGILILSCYLGAFAAMRYPSLSDREAYIKVVLEYSGKTDFFNQIDLLFFYQWPSSKLRDNGKYKKLKQHAEVTKTLKSIYGNEADVKLRTRYVSQEELLHHIKAATIPGFDESNLRQKLPLFSLAELLYRYLRCDAVHNADYPFFDKVTDFYGNVRYKPNSALTESVLLETTNAVCNSLWKKCKEKGRWPNEL